MKLKINFMYENQSIKFPKNIAEFTKMWALLDLQITATG